MKKLHRSSTIVTVFLGCFLSSLLLAGVAQAQLNEKKVERDASGLYKGTTSGGTFSVVYDDPMIPGFSFAADPGDGKCKVPVKDGKLGSTLNDPDLHGEPAVFSGREVKSKVTRGGKKIGVKATGGMTVNEGEGYGPWQGGEIVGDLTEKGPAWNADTTISGYQRNGDPPDHTKSLTGAIVKGKD